MALSIFSLAVMALMKVAGENTRTASLVGERAMAAVVAENRIIEAVTGIAPVVDGETKGADTAAGRLWRWTRRISPTADLGMVRIDLAVAPDGGAQPVARLTAFRGRP